MRTGILKWAASFLLVSAVITTEAQITDELLQLSTQNIQGTARFSAMGGAFTALGGDFGALSLNPAGIGTYRSSEISFTPAVTYDKTTTDFMNKSLSDSRTRFGLSNFGYVGTLLTKNTTGLVSLNFGIGYNKTANFNKRTRMEGWDSPNTLVNSFVDYANNAFGGQGLNPDYLMNDYRDILPEDWTTSMAFYGNGKDHTPADGLILDDGTKYYQDHFNNAHDLVDIAGRSIQKGSTGEYVLSFGGNISNKFQFGITLGMQDLEYHSENIYNEVYVEGNIGLTDPDGYHYMFNSLQRGEYSYTSGFGVNVKTGIIFKPIDAFRIGLAFHSPTWYNMKREYNTYLDYSIYDANANRDINSSSDSPVDLYEYRLQTPYRLQVGIAYIMGKVGLISVDYEFVGNKGMRIHDDLANSDFAHERNDIIKDTYKGSSNIRAGIEFNLPYGFMVRGGFNYLESPYNDTDLDFDRYGYSAGFGYRNKWFFADFAYTLNTGKYHYAPYFVNDNRIRKTDVNAVAAVEKENTNIFLATIGFKF